MSVEEKKVDIPSQEELQEALDLMKKAYDIMRKQAREGKNFGYIPNYLRTGRLILPPDAGELLREELLEEAEFYQIRGIVEELRHRPNLPFKDSTILSTEQKQVLSTNG